MCWRVNENQALTSHNEKSIDLEVNSQRVPQALKVITPEKVKWVGKRITAFS